jgi:hypothetical protein
VPPLVCGARKVGRKARRPAIRRSLAELLDRLEAALAQSL